ncbi:MAG: phosphate acyltransferase PlsX [Bacteroidia bacterium]
MKIGFDIMGGDFAPKNCLDGAIQAIAELPLDVTVVLIGDEPTAKAYLTQHNADLSRFEFAHASEVLAMGEHPTKALAQKPNSSISIGYRLLKEEKIQAFASAGNTGAMLVGAMFSVKAVPGVIRPCITSMLPKENGGFGVILDVGTNADCKPDVLYQFGILGSVYAQEVYKIKNPKVALLNIGEEAEKGNLVSQATHNLMKGSRDFNFVGNVEGFDMFSDKADVIVCEGFTGNVVLKTAEAFYTLIKKRKRSDEYFDKFNYELYGATPILGINSNVLIGHGISSALAFKNTLLLAKDIVEAKLSDKIKHVFQ